MLNFQEEIQNTATPDLTRSITEEEHEISCPGCQATFTSKSSFDSLCGHCKSAVGETLQQSIAPDVRDPINKMAASSDAIGREDPEDETPAAGMREILILILI